MCTNVYIITISQSLFVLHMLWYCTCVNNSYLVICTTKYYICAHLCTVWISKGVYLINYFSCDEGIVWVTNKCNSEKNQEYIQNPKKNMYHCPLVGKINVWHNSLHQPYNVPIIMREGLKEKRYIYGAGPNWGEGVNLQIHTFLFFLNPLKIVIYIVYIVFF